MTTHTGHTERCYGIAKYAYNLHEDLGTMFRLIDALTVQRDAARDVLRALIDSENSIEHKSWCHGDDCDCGATDIISLIERARMVLK